MYDVRELPEYNMRIKHALEDRFENTFEDILYYALQWAFLSGRLEAGLENYRMLKS